MHNRRGITTREDAIKEFVFAIGLVLAFEGLLCAAFPGAMRKAMLEASQLPESPMRLVGLVSAVLGIALLWLIKAA